MSKTIKKDFFAPLASGLGAMRRAAMMLLVIMLTMTAQTAWAIDVTYIDENGNEKTVKDAIVLNGGGATTLTGGLYVVNSNITYTGTVTLENNVKIILMDGYTMKIGTSESRLSGKGIYNNTTETLTIYGQTNGTGTLSVYTTGEYNYAIRATAITINGGRVIADTNGNYSAAIYSGGGSVTINGGKVTAHTVGSGASAIYAHTVFTYNGGIVSASTEDASSDERGYNAPAIASDNYTFNWRSATDRITIGTTGLSFDPNAPSGYETTATFSKPFSDGTTTYSGTLTDTELNALANKTLQPCYAVTFDANSGSFSSGTTILLPAKFDTSGNAYVSAPATYPTRDGYSFGGWYNGTDAYDFTAAVTGDLTLTAHWTENIATLTEADPIAPLTAMSGMQTKVSFTRSGLTVGKYSTICLPFDFTASETCTFYKFDGVKKVGNDWVADISATTGGTANTPYIFTTDATSVTFSNDAVTAAASYSDATAKTSITDWTFQGTYAQISLPNVSEYDYGFAAGSNSDGVNIGDFVHLVSGASAAPFRAYLKYTGSDTNWAKTRGDGDALPSRIIVRIVGANGDATAIGTLVTRTGEISTGDWYSLDGRRLHGKPAKKGLYLNNGRKVVIK